MINYNLLILLCAADSLQQKITVARHLILAHLLVMGLTLINILHIIHCATLLLLDDGAVGEGDLVTLLLQLWSTLLVLDLINLIIILVKILLTSTITSLHRSPHSGS